MKKKVWVFVVLLVSQFGFGEPLVMFAPGDRILEEIKLLSLESGTPFNSFTPPLSSYEIRNFLTELDKTDAYFEQKLNPKIRFQSGLFSSSFNLLQGIACTLSMNHNHGCDSLFGAEISAGIEYTF